MSNESFPFQIGTFECIVVSNGTHTYSHYTAPPSRLGRNRTDLGASFSLPFPWTRLCHTEGRGVAVEAIEMTGLEIAETACAIHT